MRISDWSSDVCSSDLRPEAAVAAFTGLFERDDLSPGLRVMVFRLHEKRLPHALGTIYERTNASLEAAGFGGMGSASKPRQGSRVVQVPVGHAVGAANAGTGDNGGLWRSEEHTSELQSLMRISYAVFCSKKTTYTPIAAG